MLLLHTTIFFIFIFILSGKHLVINCIRFVLYSNILQQLKGQAKEIQTFQILPIFFIKTVQNNNSICEQN